MTKQITIQGVEFTVSAPYAEGHQISEAEAKALNQVRSENIRNNQAKLVKAAKEEFGEELSEDIIADLQNQITAYDEGYEFTLASVGGGRKTRDPYEAEALKIARDAVTAKIKDTGKRVKDYDKDALNAKIAEIAERDAVKKAAKKAVDERNKLASDSLGDLEL